MGQNSIAFAALETAVRLDALTGVLNRRGFEDAWRELTDAAGASKAAVGLVYLDWDGFKAINDNYGHAAGDAALCEIAKLLATAVRNSDSVARMGGDEIAILVRNPTCEADVQQVAAKAVMAVRSRDWSSLGGQLDASVGTVYVPHGESLVYAIDEADERMLMAKRVRKAESRSTRNCNLPERSPHEWARSVARKMRYDGP